MLRLCLMVIAVALLAVPAHAAAAQKWVASWAQAMTSDMAATGHGDVAHRDFTLRQTVLLSAGGSRVRIRLSNYFGSKPLAIASAHIALAAANPQDPARIVKASDRVLRFHGGTSVVIAPGQAVASDAVALDVPALATVVVSLYFADEASLSDMHPMEHAATTMAVDGNAAGAETLAQDKRLRLAGDDTAPHIYVLSGVDVMADRATRGIVAFGDSITDGAFASSPARTWPGVIAALGACRALLGRAANAPGAVSPAAESCPVQAAQGGDAATFDPPRGNAPDAQAPMAVVNMGISADELTTDQIGQPGAGMSGLKRFERDVIDQPGVTDVLVLLGTNDINRGIDRAGQPDGALAGDIIDSLRMLVDVAHQHGLRIYLATVPPFAGFTLPGWFTPEKEAVRQQVNQWIEHDAKVDGVLPFAAALRGTYRPSPLAALQHPLPPGMASICAGDAGLHPNDRGYAVMGTLAFDILSGQRVQAGEACH